MLTINNSANSVQFPDHDIDPSKKDKTWHMRWAEALYSRYVNDQTAMPYSVRSEIDLYRLYSIGNQPVEKYMDRLAPKDPRTQTRNGYMNISWDIIPIIPKFREIILGMFEKMDYDVYADAIDEKAEDERDYLKWRSWALKTLNERLVKVGTQQNIEEMTGNPTYVPGSIQELEMMAQLGAFKLIQEINIEKLLRYSFYLSDWPDVKRRIFEDLFDIGYAITKDYVDPINGQALSRYVDPKAYITNYSSGHTFKNKKAAGELVGKTMSDLRRDAKDQITEEEYKSIETFYSGYQPNLSDTYFDGISGYEENRDYNVQIMDMEFFDYDIKKYEVKTNRYNQKFVYDKDYNYSKKKTNNREPAESYKKTVRRCKWIVGTKICYDWGYQHDIIRPQKNEAKLSFTAYKHSDKSILSRMIPIADNFQMTYLKLNNAIAMSAPSGLKVEVNSLKNVEIGGKKKGPLELLRIYRQTGDILYSATTHHSEFQAVGGTPVDRMVGGVGPELQEYITIMNHNLDLMRQVVGISPAMDQSNLNPEIPVGTSKIQVGASNNIMHNLFVGYEYIKEHTARNMALRWQIIAKYRDVKGYYPAVSRQTLESVKVNAGTDFGQMGIRIEMRPTVEQKAELKQLALGSYTASKQGAPGISVSDYMYLMRLLDNGNIKLASVYFAFKEEQAMARKEQQQQMLVEQQNQSAQMIQQQKSELEVQMPQIKEGARAQAEIQIETVKSDLRDKERGNKRENDEIYDEKKINLESNAKTQEELIKQASELNSPRNTEKS